MQKQNIFMLILQFAFFGCLIGSLYKILGRKWSCYAIISCIMGAVVSALILSYHVLYHQKVITYKFTWLQMMNLSLEFSIKFDSLTTTMALLIAFITMLVMIYSFGYLHEDPALVKFLSFLSFFCLTMLTMATAANYIQLFLGWEGVGLASYLLISFWNSRNATNQGALKAVIVNRIGDVFFLLALTLIWIVFQTFDIDAVNTMFTTLAEISYENGIDAFTFDNMPIVLIPLCLFIAIWSKSAQLLLHVWLGDAMEGPTPVSSLLHSATMVTAGVFLLLRSAQFFNITFGINDLIALLGLLTAIMSGLIGSAQTDLKKVVAFSTCSQLGYMVFICSLGYYNYVFFHVITHAFFKCLIFLCCGSIIHAVGDDQDIRKMGFLLNKLPSLQLL